MPPELRRRHPLKLKIRPRESPVPEVNIPFAGRASLHKIASVLVASDAPGVQLERVFVDLMETAQRTRPSGFLYAGVARATPQVSGCRRTLRVVCALGSQSIAVDVTLQARKNGLCARSHVLISPVVGRLRVSLFLVFWSLLSLVYVFRTDFGLVLGQTFARKYFANPDAGIAVLVQGWDVDAAPGASSPYRRVTPWRVIDYFCADPICSLHCTAVVPLVLAIAAAGMTLLIPRAAFRYPCRWLGWPTPDEIDAAVHACKRWVERLLGQCLPSNYGVGTNDLERAAPLKPISINPEAH